MREFTSLCNVKQYPLIKYLLSGRNDASSSNSAGGKAGLIKLKSQSELLAEMGGSSALGKGFTEYARKKYNTSQLAAISASAKEYGDGGITLVKGPPG